MKMNSEYDLIKSYYFSDWQVGKELCCEFVDHDTGEEFLVELKKQDESTTSFINRCYDVAREYFADPEFCRLVDPEEAEQLGIDTY